MQIFILGRTLAEQRRFAEMIQDRLGQTADAMPIFVATTEEARSLGEGGQSEISDVPSFDAFDECLAGACDPNIGYRQWRRWYQVQHHLVIGADSPDVLIGLMAHDEHNAVVYLEAEPADIAESKTARDAVEAYIRWQAGVRPLPQYRVSAEEFEALTAPSTEMYEGPSEKFFELWAA